MIIKNIIYRIDELDTQSGVIKKISPDTIENIDNFLEDYQVRNIVIDNLTGETINYALFNETEYQEYLESGTITDLISLENTSNDCLNRLDFDPEYVLIEGTTSGYINNLVVGSFTTPRGDMDMGRIYSYNFDLLAISGVILPRGFTDGFDEGFG